MPTIGAEPAAAPAQVSLDVPPAAAGLLAGLPLDTERLRLRPLALADSAEGRSYAWAAVALADGTLDTVWAESLKSPLSQASLIGGIPLIPDAKLRATAYERVMPILAMPDATYRLRPTGGWQRPTSMFTVMRMPR